MYDSGNPKHDSTVSSGTSVGDGGLQKWVFNGKTWNLDYTLSAGLNLVANTSAAGTTGLFGLTGEVVGNSVAELDRTNATVGDMDPTFLYGLTDDILQRIAKPAAGESFHAPRPRLRLTPTSKVSPSRRRQARARDLVDDAARLRRSGRSVARVAAAAGFASAVWKSRLTRFCAVGSGEPTAFSLFAARP